MADDVAGFTNLMHKYRFVPDLLKNYDADEPVKPEAQAYYAMYLEELATHLGDQRALSDDHKVLQILRNKRVPAVMFQEIHRDRTQEVPDSSDYVDVRMIGLLAAKQLSRSSRTFIERAFWEEMLAWSCDLINERRPVTEDLIGAIERRIRFVAAVNTVVTERNGRRRSFLLADTVDQQLFLQLAECTSCLSKQIAVLQRTSVPARIEVRQARGAARAWIELTLWSLVVRRRTGAADCHRERQVALQPDHSDDARAAGPCSRRCGTPRPLGCQPQRTQAGRRDSVVRGALVPRLPHAPMYARMRLSHRRTHDRAAQEHRDDLCRPVLTRVHEAVERRVVGSRAAAQGL